MRFIIEYDGCIVDVAPALYAAYCRAAGNVGWSRLQEAEFRRLIRSRGPAANLLPGAKPAKTKQFQARFEEYLEDDEIIERHKAHERVMDTMEEVTREGDCGLVTLGSNAEARRRVLRRSGVDRFISSFETLSSDPRRRPAELLALAAGERRTVVAACSDVIIRSAREASIFVAGISSGMCGIARLQQAGADIIYKRLDELAQSSTAGARDMIRAGRVQRAHIPRRPRRPQSTASNASPRRQPAIPVKHIKRHAQQARSRWHGDQTSARASRPGPTGIPSASEIVDPHSASSEEDLQPGGGIERHGVINCDGDAAVVIADAQRLAGSQIQSGDMAVGENRVRWAIAVPTGLR